MAACDVREAGTRVAGTSGDRTPGFANRAEEHRNRIQHPFTSDLLAVGHRGDILDEAA